MNSEESILVKLLFLILEQLGAALVRKKTDEWEAARVPSDVAFEAKWGEKP